MNKSAKNLPFLTRPQLFQDKRLNCGVIERQPDVHNALKAVRLQPFVFTQTHAKTVLRKKFIFCVLRLSCFCKIFLLEQQFCLPLVG
jgi:hypothetical protein